jgi:hypothetical protein
MRFSKKTDIWECLFPSVFLFFLFAGRQNRIRCSLFV